MAKLSININKIATLRNARGGNNPDIVKTAIDCQRFGAEGITVHPRPDERHIRYQDVFNLRSIVKTEFNIEGNPTQKFLDLVKKVLPEQVTLVPDSPDALTSNAGWDTVKNEKFLTDVIKEFKRLKIRTSIFIDPVEKMIEGAAKVGTDRVELYTESYAKQYLNDKYKAIKPYILSAKFAKDIGLEVNAGHDLDLNNLNFLIQKIPFIKEVSIGHALICDALYFGLENTIQLYLKQLKSSFAASS